MSLVVDFTSILTDQITLWTEKSKEWNNDLKKKQKSFMVGDKTNTSTQDDVHTGKVLMWHHKMRLSITTLNTTVKKMVKQMKEVMSSIGLHPINRNEWNTHRCTNSNLLLLHDTSKHRQTMLPQMLIPSGRRPCRSLLPWVQTTLQILMVGSTDLDDTTLFIAG